ncbi:MAG: hypothetical protein M1833_006519 [Piccolia ochrophora]|nr:MAG: hypothetical protein M1833_006519 [Piccolia ochrophora]
MSRAFNFGEFENGKAQQPLSSVLTEHEAELDHFFGRCQKLCAKILRLFALGLEIDHQGGGEDWFSSKHDPAKGPSGSVLRLLYYPALAPSMEHDPSADLRAGAHSDYGSITLLFQRPGQPGLEIQNPSSEWSPVPVSPAGTEDDAVPPILVNIGDLLSYWTNGLFKSTVHRVIFPKEGRKGGQDRYSIAYFCHPLNTTELVPVPSPKVSVRREGSAGEDGRAMTAEEHLNRRLAATYGWVKDEEGGVGVEMMHTSGRS